MVSPWQHWSGQKGECPPPVAVAGGSEKTAKLPWPWAASTSAHPSPMCPCHKCWCPTTVWLFLESRGWPGAQLCRLLLPGPPLGFSCPSEQWVQQQGFLGSVWVNEGLPAMDKSPPRGTWGSLLFLLLQDTQKMV